MRRLWNPALSPGILRARRHFLAPLARVDDRTPDPGSLLPPNLGARLGNFRPTRVTSKMTSNPPSGCIVVGPNRDGGIALASVDEPKPTDTRTPMRRLISDELLCGSRPELTENLHAIGEIERFLDEKVRDS